MARFVAGLKTMRGLLKDCGNERQVLDAVGITPSAPGPDACTWDAYQKFQLIKLEARRLRKGPQRGEDAGISLQLGAAVDLIAAVAGAHAAIALLHG